MCRFGDVKPASHFDFRAAEVIPTSQFLNGDSKTVGDCDEGIAATNLIQGGCPGGGTGYQRDDEGADIGEVRGTQIVHVFNRVR